MTSATGQRTDVLSAINSVTLDANGNGTCSVSPSVGQYWAPLLIRVSTRLSTVPVPLCVIYHGANTVKDLTTYIDDTATGSNDSSSIIAGVTVQYGESITAVWSAGTPGDTAFLIVNGVTLNQPPSVGQLPQVPGTHFSGKLSTEIVNKIASVGSGSPVSILAGASTFLPGPTSSQTFDLRSYSSFYFVCQATTSGTPTAFNSYLLTFDWFSLPGILNPTYTETMEVWASGVGGGFTFVGNPFTVQDEAHGPFLRITVLNTAVADTVQFSYSLTGTSRIINTPSRQQSQSGIMLSVISNAIPASGTAMEPCQYLAGRYLAMFNNTGAANQTFAIHFASLPFSINTVVAAGATTTLESIAPKKALRIDVVGVVGQTYNIRLISLYDKVS